MANEQCLRFTGHGEKPAILLVPPLFDEANRMRRTLVMTMCTLSERGHASLLPDLPGQNDSMAPNEEASLDIWRAALADIAAREGQPLLIASWRGGALIDDAASGGIGWWRMAPLAGSTIVKTLIRVRIAGEKEAGRAASTEQIRALAQHGPVELGGNRLSPTMVDALDCAVPAMVAPLRTVDVADIGGSALWLRAEPGEDRAMAQAMAHNISEWATICAAG
ncbi:MAG: hypothetical protein ABL909_04435 [Sphingopyxis sp.]